MNENYRSFIGQSIAVGDEVEYNLTAIFESGSHFDIKSIGEITNFDKNYAYIDCEYCDNPEVINKKHRVPISNIICKIPDGSNYWWK